MDSCFEPVIWPEDKLPKEAVAYRECEVCTEKARIIWGEGNPKAPVVIILDNPGAREDKDGHEYVCGTRQTLQTALHQADLAPDDIYITYLLKCRPLRRYNKEEARAFSKSFLIQQIKTIQPQLLVCLGDTVVQAMFDDQEAHVKNLRGSWHVILGYPCIVSYHPLAVRRRPNLARQFREDWDMLRQRLSGC
ncbi:uracil-DNA glycosylase, family 4 [Desulfitobacterium hafniense DP7]|uniref:Uracil-DNA glycosylase, family 4 n=1 Tax=Desulfitobacterium hafniense DP7 TaxID=537010 RepID=G9XJ58_DESHA|nr:uracil-DNA glycosylase [Desulfitobacterium hafniense]EHL08342.1 uracil-DNA glycosylase, family 4 [Desulfitobacterium hafniense DP7]